MTTTSKIAAFVALAALACGPRQHLTETQGRALRAATARQAVHGTEAREPVLGLDSQEAAIVAESYRKGLAPKGEKPQEQPILMVAPAKEGRMTPLPPSVPR